MCRPTVLVRRFPAPLNVLPQHPARTAPAVGRTAGEVGQPRKWRWQCVVAGQVINIPSRLDMFSYHPAATNMHTSLPAFDTHIVEVHTAPTHLPCVQVAPRHHVATATHTCWPAHDTQIVQQHTAPTHLPRVQASATQTRRCASVDSVTARADSTGHEQAWKHDPSDVASHVASRRLTQAVNQHKQKKTGKTLKHMRAATLTLGIVHLPTIQCGRCTVSKETRRKGKCAKASVPPPGRALVAGQTRARRERQGRSATEARPRAASARTNGATWQQAYLRTWTMQHHGVS
jgi:hypothetical protein